MRKLSIIEAKTAENDKDKLLRIELQKKKLRQDIARPKLKREIAKINSNLKDLAKEVDKTDLNKDAIDQIIESTIKSLKSAKSYISFGIKLDRIKPEDWIKYD